MQPAQFSEVAATAGVTSEVSPDPLLRSPFLWIYLLGAFLLGIPSYFVWFRQPFLVTRYEYDFFFGWFLNESGNFDLQFLMLGKVLHFTLVVIIGWAYCRLVLALADVEDRLTWPRIAVAAAAAAAIAFAYVPWLSPDVFFYFGTGWLDYRYGANPYQAVIADVPGYQADPMFQNVMPGWLHIITPYGPLFVKFIAGLTALGGGQELLCLILIKAVLVVYHGLNGVIVHAIAKLLNFKPRLTTLTYLLNPAPLLTYIGWAHNDVMMLTFLLAAIWALVQDRPVLTTVCLGLGAGLKYVPVLFFPLFFIYLTRGRPLARRILDGFLLGGLLAAVVILPNLLYDDGLRNFVRLFRGQDQIYRNFLYILPLLAYAEPDLQSMQQVKMALKLVFLGAYALILARLWKAGARLQADSFFAAAGITLLLYFTVGSPEIHEWYIGWFLCFFLWVNRRPYFQVALFLTTAISALVIFEVRSPFAVQLAAVQTCFLLLWGSLFHIWRQRLLRDERPSLLSAAP